MAKYLINRTDIFRVDNEQEAKDFIEELKKTSGGDVVKHSIEYKEQKQTGTRSTSVGAFTTSSSLKFFYGL